MAHDNARAVPQPVLQPAAQDIALPTPRPPVLEPAAHEIARPGPRPPVPEPAAHEIARPAPRPVLAPAAHDIARPAPRPVHGSRAGWMMLTATAAAAAWAAGWVAGVSWAWRAVTPRYLRRTHWHPGAGLPGAGSPLRP